MITHSMNDDTNPGGGIIRQIWGSDYPLQVKRSRIGRYPIRSHRLAYHKLCLVLKGECRLQCGSQPYHLKPGDLYFCEPLTPQSFTVKESQRIEYYEVIFNAPTLLERFPEWRRHAPGIVMLLERRTAEPIPSFFDIPENVQGIFRENFCALAEEFLQSGSSDDLLGQQFARLVLMLRDARRISTRAAPAEERPGHPTIERILRRMRKDFAQPLSASELAGEVGWSTAYLARAFKRNTGDTLTRTLNRIRIEHAAHLLLATDRPVSDIAMACGYNEIPYFNRRFKLLLGASPTDYRLSRVPGSAPQSIPGTGNGGSQV